MLLVLPAGGFLLLHNEIALTDLILAILLCGGMLRPLLKISHFFTDSREVLAGVRRLNPVLNADNSAEHAQQAEGADPVSSREEGIDVELSRVRFSYDKALIIPEMDLTLPAGVSSVELGKDDEAHDLAVVTIKPAPKAPAADEAEGEEDATEE